MTTFSDTELFDNSFYEWAELHGVTILGKSAPFRALVDLNKLKAAIIEREEAAANAKVVEAFKKFLDDTQQCGPDWGTYGEWVDALESRIAQLETEHED